MLFSHWADIVSKRTTAVFLLSFIIQIAMGAGVLFFERHYKDQSLLWTPKVSLTVVSWPDKTNVRTGQPNFEEYRA